MVWKQGFGDNWDTNGLLGCFSGHVETRILLLSIHFCLSAPESCFPTALSQDRGVQEQTEAVNFQTTQSSCKLQPAQKKNTALHISFFR